MLTIALLQAAVVKDDTIGRSTTALSLPTRSSESLWRTSSFACASRVRSFGSHTRSSLGSSFCPSVVAYLPRRPGRFESAVI